MLQGSIKYDNVIIRSHTICTGVNENYSYKVNAIVQRQPDMTALSVHLPFRK
jgi:hypothetical protein